ncbi:hypothetical protein [Aneurinibacillus migulanus]|uniref:Uncharacterized protein n=1 Tax=Aneurinibacillus migulanus TaxID=47500 RepID=A0A1G9C0R8_ANEMI|nr:hypothetical protein [Aneurinibacillus migulanus]MCP1355239.1 hypothetical protein [Aneurinibacillus migulanus]MED0892026.1 hypothetical protein [Aneurinibacillus migulanus]MED1618336.1 hypothetical protein [Aneurinibacillus migulanus]MED4730052.1 hypothetical protein [Aneurinibacillus migulanus]SDK45203.1 hypothetical protein SAMN04487909_15618 [Aneurinibacillus migulanus]
MKKQRKSNLKLGKETFGDKDIYEAFAEALSPYFVISPKPEEEKASNKSS